MKNVKELVIVMFAGILLASLPVVLLVIAFHEKIMENVSTGGIKG